jgi:uncharacterized damage-inducible protein DinB
LAKWKTRRIRAGCNACRSRLRQAITDLEKYAADLSDAELLNRPNDSPSAAFHLRHIAGSINRLLTYSRGEELSEAQFEFLRAENSLNSDLNAAELTGRAIDEINKALAALQNVAPESLFEERFVGRKRLPTNVFGLLFHIAEHTARHVGQIITISKIVRKEKTN